MIYRYLRSVLPNSSREDLEQVLRKAVTGGDRYLENFLPGGVFENLERARHMGPQPSDHLEVRNSSAQGFGLFPEKLLPPRDY